MSLNTMDAAEVETKILWLKQSLEHFAKDSSLLRDEIYLFLWLKANRMNVHKTELAIREGLKWRQEHHIDSIYTERLPKQLINDLPLFVDGVSRAGVPIAYYHAGEPRFAKLMKIYGDENVSRYWIQLAKQLENFILTTNRNRIQNPTLEDVHTCLAIVDIHGFSFKNLPTVKEIRTVLELGRECMKQFPILPAVCMFINVNRAFQIPFRLIQPFLQGLGFVIRIYGTDEGSWKEVFDLVSIEQIRDFQRRASACSSLT